jgi:acyl-CoA dehydrogenase
MALDFSLSPEQQAVRDTADQLVKRFLPHRDEFRRMIFDRHEFPEMIWQGLAEAGFLGAIIPEEYGGTGLGLLPLTFAVESLGKEGFGGALLVLSAMDTACIVKNGSADMKKRMLPKIASGELKLCFALTEAEAGTNAFRMRTSARKEGDEFVINGEKTFITGADVAHYMLLATRSMPLEQAKAQGFPRTWGFSLFLVDTKAKGISMTKLRTRGVEGHNQYTIHFDNVRVPAANIVGEEDGGMAALFTSLNPERILAAAIASGMTEYLIKKSVDYANERKLFRDQPIGAYQAIQHPLARLTIELEATRHLVYRAAWSYDQDMAPDEIGFWANAAKLKASELGVQAADQAIQTHGGAGFDEDVGIILYWNALRLLKTAPINNEMILNFVAEHRLGLPRSY